LGILGSRLVRLIDDDDIADLEQAGLYRLHPVTEPGGLDHHDCVGKRCDIGAVLARANRLNQNQRVTNRIEKMD
jgi:hypothetical protein